MKKMPFLLGMLFASALSLAQGEISKADQAFINKAAQGGMTEVALGSLASEKGATAAVKSFGAMMVTDHGQADSELAAIGRQIGAKVPAQLNKKNTEAVKEMAQLSGAAFDARYVTVMVAGHEKALALFQAASKTLVNPELKAFAAKTIPMIEMHLEKIRAIKKSL